MRKDIKKPVNKEVIVPYSAFMKSLKRAMTNTIVKYKGIPVGIVKSIDKKGVATIVIDSGILISNDNPFGEIYDKRVLGKFPPLKPLKRNKCN